jgi:bile acid:Na+ symporter, BASS family
MSLDWAIGPVVGVTLIEMMFATGLGVRLADVVGAAADRHLVLRAGLANYVAVPLVTVVLLRLLDADPTVAIGLLILAVCPGAPYGPPLSALAGGSPALSIGLMVMLAGSSVLVAPLLLPVLLPLTPAGADVQVDPLGMLFTILLTQLVPLCCGLGLNQSRPALAARLLGPAVALGKILNAAMLALVLASYWTQLLEVRLAAVLGMLTLLGFSLLCGWLAGGARQADRRAVALTTSIRNVGLGIGVTATAFAGTSAVTAVLAYGLVQLFGSLLVALWWRQSVSLAQAS